MKFAAARVCLNNICNKANHFVKRIKKSLKFRIKIHRKKNSKGVNDRSEFKHLYEFNGSIWKNFFIETKEDKKNLSE